MWLLPIVDYICNRRRVTQLPDYRFAKTAFAGLNCFFCMLRAEAADIAVPVPSGQKRNECVCLPLPLFWGSGGIMDQLVSDPSCEERVERCC